MFYYSRDSWLSLKREDEVGIGVGSDIAEGVFYITTSNEFNCTVRIGQHHEAEVKG
jgi:hypothetical protein